ncbi:MAG: TlpA disulfide reductase family protein [Candidatus Thorarchaeota archaeon]
MEPEKMVIVGVVLVVVVVGLTVGVSLFTFQDPNDGGDHGTGLTEITLDVDLLELGLQVPSDWEFEMADGSTLQMSDLDGKIILVDLMATWCSSCASQNTYLQSVYDTLAGPLEILSLTIDHSETVGMIADYQSDNGLPWDHGLDTDAKFTSYFSVTSVPTLVLIDSDGYFRYVHVGTWTTAVISDKIVSITT